MGVALASFLGGITWQVAAFLAAVLFIAIQEFRGGWSSIRELTVRQEGLSIVNPYGRRFNLSWKDLRTIDTVDRGRAHPRRLIRLVGSGGRTFFVSDRLERFDRAVDVIRSRAPHVVIRPMPLRDRLLWLQWGV